jgi:uncharacterized membrane protein YeiH
MQTQFDLIGLFAFGVSGALMATRLHFDVVGIAFLAVITSLGGGILRKPSRDGFTPNPRYRRDHSHPQPRP